MSLEKRSIRYSGKRTSIALEPLFWTGVENLAHTRGVSIPQLCAIVDNARSSDGPAAQSLASSLRCTVLQHALDSARKPASLSHETNMEKCAPATPQN